MRNLIPIRWLFSFSISIFFLFSGCDISFDNSFSSKESSPVINNQNDKKAENDFQYDEDRDDSKNTSPEQTKDHDENMQENKNINSFGTDTDKFEGVLINDFFLVEEKYNPSNTMYYQYFANSMEHCVPYGSSHCVIKLFDAESQKEINSFYIAITSLSDISYDLIDWKDDKSFFLSEGFGDGCSSFENVYVYNVKTKTTDSFLSKSSDCIPGYVIRVEGYPPLLFDGLEPVHNEQRIYRIKDEFVSQQDAGFYKNNGKEETNDFDHLSPDLDRLEFLGKKPFFERSLEHRKSADYYQYLRDEATGVVEHYGDTYYESQKFGMRFHHEALALNFREYENGIDFGGAFDVEGNLSPNFVFRVIPKEEAETIEGIKERLYDLFGRIPGLFEIFSVHDLTALRFEDIGMCDGPTINIYGESFVYQFRKHCGGFDVLNEIIETIEFFSPEQQLSFDNCGKPEKYSSQEWFSDFFRQINQRYSGEHAISEMCLAKDGSMVIAAVEGAYMDENNYSRVFRYFPSERELHEADVKIDGKKNTELMFQRFLSFGKRDGNIVPVYGRFGDAGHGSEHVFFYDFQKNVLTFQKECFISPYEDVEFEKCHQELEKIFGIPLI